MRALTREENTGRLSCKCGGKAFNLPLNESVDHPTESLGEGCQPDRNWALPDLNLHSDIGFAAQLGLSGQSSTES